MRVCYLANNLDPNNGWGRYSSDLISGVRSAGIETVILKESDDGFEGSPILKRGYRIFSSAIKCRRYFRDCDIIHAIDINPYGLIAYLGSLFLKKPIVISVLGTYSIAPLHSKRLRFLSRVACLKAKAIISISHFTKKKLLSEISDLDVQVVTPPINFSKFHRPRLDTNSEPFIVSVGALMYRKGYHISIPAFAKVKKHFPNLKYKIVGNQNQVNYFDQLKKLTIDHDVEDSVEFISGITDEDLSHLYQTAMLFILASVNHQEHFEGFGIVFLEAAAAGLPVVGTLGNGIEDAVNNGYNGLLAKQGDVEDLANKVIQILQDQTLWSRMSANSYVWSKDHNIDRATSQFLKIYQSL